MKKRMPEVLRQVELYERNLKNSNQVKNPKTAPQFRNV